MEAATGFDFFADWKEAEQKKVETSSDTTLWNFNKDRYKTEKEKNCLKYNKQHPGEKCSCKVKAK